MKTLLILFIMTTLSGPPEIITVIPVVTFERCKEAFKHVVPMWTKEYPNGPPLQGMCVEIPKAKVKEREA